MSRSVGHRPPELVRVAFIALCCLWMVLPLGVHQNLAQDAIPYLVAGELVGHDDASIYASKEGDLFNLKPEFATRACELSPPGTDCSTFSVAYVSTPLSLPFAKVVSMLGPDLGIATMRLLASGCLVAGMVLLWRRLSPRHPQAGGYLLVSAVLLTPFVMVPVGLGQTSPFLFLVAALGVRGTERNRRAALVGAALAVASAFKLFPVALGAVAALQRRWRLLAWTAGWLVVMAVATLGLVPPSIAGEFVQATRAISNNAVGNPYNGSIANAVHLLVPSFDGTGPVAVVLLAATVAGVAWLWWWGVRKADDDTQWAFGLVLLLLLTPLVWWHYAWVGISSACIAVAGLRRVDLSHLRALLVLVALTVPISVPNARGFSVPLAQCIWLVAAVVFTAVIARRQVSKDGTRPRQRLERI